MESNDMWLNVKGNYILLIEIQNVAITLNFGYFLTHLKQRAVSEKVGE